MKQITEDQRKRALSKLKRSKKHQEAYIAKKLEYWHNTVEMVEGLLNDFDSYVSRGGMRSKEQLEKDLICFRGSLVYYAIGEEIDTPHGVYRRILL